MQMVPCVTLANWLFIGNTTEAILTSKYDAPHPYICTCVLFVLTVLFGFSYDVAPGGMRQECRKGLKHLPTFMSKPQGLSRVLVISIFFSITLSITPV